MPKKAKELSAIQVRRLLKQEGSHAVGGVRGLYLRVRGDGASWLLRARSASEPESVHGLGSFPETDLATARDKARTLRRQLELGQDPKQEQRAARTALATAVAQELAASVSFETAATDCHAKKAQEFKNPKHAAQWISTLKTYAFPKIGAIPVRDVTRADVLRVLRPIWTTKPETASRVQQRLFSVLAWAKASGYRGEGDNPAQWQGGLDQLLPNTSKVREQQHHAALPWQDVPAFVQRLRKWPGIAALPLEFLILTASRSQEVRFALPAELDLTAAVWTVPAERMKKRKQHRVPLVGRALEIVQTAPRKQDNPFLFPGENGGGLSENTLAKTLRMMKVDAVPHGFRSSFKDWCRNLATGYADEVSELALAHVSTDATRAAYARDELLEPRRKLMMEWAAYCCGSN